MAGTPGSWGWGSSLESWLKSSSVCVAQRKLSFTALTTSSRSLCLSTLKSLPLTLAKSSRGWCLSRKMFPVQGSGLWLPFLWSTIPFAFMVGEMWTDTFYTSYQVLTLLHRSDPHILPLLATYPDKPHLPAEVIVVQSFSIPSEAHREWLRSYDTDGCNSLPWHRIFGSGYFSALESFLEQKQCPRSFGFCAVEVAITNQEQHPPNL